MPQDANQPNVIVFFTDQQRWDTSGLHGNPLDLDTKFRSDGTARDTCPAFIYVPTGLRALRAHAFKRDYMRPARAASENGIPLSPNLKTLAHHFGEAGYATGYIGKWHLYSRSGAGPGPVPAEHRGGYDYWLASNVLEFTSDAYQTTLYDNDNKPVDLPGYRVDALTDAVIRYVDRHQNDPFYLFTSYIEPHHQNHLDDYPPPDGYRERYTAKWIPPDLAALGGSTHQHLGGYYGMVKRLDEALGRLLDALKSLHLLDNTIILFTSDHACHFKTRNSEYKRSCHESSIRVPTAFHGGDFIGGGQIQELVSLVDLPPTLLDAAGLEVPTEMQGRSIMPLVRGETEGWPEEVFVQISEAQVGRAVRTQRWKYGVDAPNSNAGRDAGSDRYVEQYLYDLQVDPYELRNLIGLQSHEPVTEVMRERLIRRMLEAGEEAPTVEPAPTQRSGQRSVTEAEARS